jgi:uncharacterized integral membrane protein
VKRFSWILTLPLIAVAAIFAIANREPITLDLWPFEASPQLPLFVVLLACVGFGLVVGGLATWLSAAPARRRARQARRQVAELEREAVRLRQERDRAANAVAPPVDSGQPGPPGLPAPAPAPERRSALGR